MPYTVKPHSTLARHFYVNGTLVAGAKDADDAVSIYEAAQNTGDEQEP